MDSAPTSPSFRPSLCSAFRGGFIALLAAASVASATGTSIVVSVPNPVTNDPVATGVMVTAGKTYVIRANITIVPKVYKDQAVIDPLSVVRATGGVPLATIDGTAIVNAIPLSTFTPTMDVTLTYVPKESGGLYLRLLAIPTAITFNSISVDLPPSAPVVKVVTKRALAGGKLLLKGTAAGEEKIVRVNVAVNGKSFKAVGTTAWTATLPLRAGLNKITVIAYDRTGQASKAVNVGFTMNQK